MTKMRSTDKKTRITVDLSQEFYQRLEELEELVGAESKASVIRDALRLYEYIAKETKEGHSFMLKKGGEAKEVVFLNLPL